MHSTNSRYRHLLTWLNWRALYRMVFEISASHEIPFQFFNKNVCSIELNCIPISCGFIENIWIIRTKKKPSSTKQIVHATKNILCKCSLSLADGKQTTVINYARTSERSDFQNCLHSYFRNALCLVSSVSQSLNGQFENQNIYIGIFFWIEFTATINSWTHCLACTAAHSEWNGPNASLPLSGFNDVDREKLSEKKTNTNCCSSSINDAQKRICF